MTAIDATTLLRAYSIGIFPMAQSREDPELYWYEPEFRGVLPLDGFHVPRRLARRLRSDAFLVSTDAAFERVVRACAAPRPGHPETWINETIVELYTDLHERGHAHSVECWTPDGDLVGGLYGVSLGRAFFGESMFSRATDASKVALCALVAFLRADGFALLDTQYLTDHLTQFGVIEIPRAVYRARLQAAIAGEARLHSRAESSSSIVSSMLGFSAGS